MNCPSNVAGVSGYVTLTPAIRTLPRFPVVTLSEFQTNLQNDPTGLRPVYDEDPPTAWTMDANDQPHTMPLVTMVSNGDSVPDANNCWKTNTTVFAVQCAVVGNDMAPGSQEIDNVYALDVDNVTNSYGSSGQASWKRLWTPKSLVVSHYLYPQHTPNPSIPYLSTGVHITSLDAAALPDGTKLLSIRGHTTQFDSCEANPANHGPYLVVYKYDSTAQTFTSVGGPAMDPVPSSGDYPYYGGTTMAVNTGTSPASSDIHWTKWLGTSDTILLSRSRTTGSSLGGETVLSGPTDDFRKSIMGDSVEDRGGRTISATFDDRMNWVRASWPQVTGGNVPYVIAGRTNGDDTGYNVLQGTLSGISGDKHYVTSISNGRSYTGGSAPTWNKAAGLALGTAMASSTDGANNRRWVCQTTNSGGWSDSWSVLDSGNPTEDDRCNPAVGFRGLHLPRYGWINSDSYGGTDGTVIVDGVATGYQSSGIVLKTNSKNWIDQYLLSRPKHWTNGNVYALTPLHP